ncbi:hypothetical protein GGH95_002748 [Coemansia sp. RSA 1836]|nr:hypothetical protein GGH95_002748 [Coemansia sp. RSA 1836]
MFKITILVCALSLVAIQAYPVARSETPEETELLRRGGCGGFGCGDGIHFTASNLFPSSQFVGAGFRHTTLFPELTFSTGSRFSLPGMQPCGGMVGQPCGTAPPPQEATPPPQVVTPPPQVVTPPPQAMPPSAPPAPQGCDQAPGVQCNGPPQQAPPQQAPPQQAPPQEAPPRQAPPTEMPPQQAPPQEAPAQPTPPAPGAAPCDQAQGQACDTSGPTSFNFGNNQSKAIKASSYKETTLYYNHKDAKSASKSANSSTQLNYTKN